MSNRLYKAYIVFNKKPHISCKSTYIWFTHYYIGFIYNNVVRFVTTDIFIYILHVPTLIYCIVKLCNVEKNNHNLE